MACSLDVCWLSVVMVRTKSPRICWTRAPTAVPVEAPGVTCCGWKTPGAGGVVVPLSDITASCEQAPNAKMAMSAATRDFLITMGTLCLRIDCAVTFLRALPKSVRVAQFLPHPPKKTRGWY